MSARPTRMPLLYREMLADGLEHNRDEAKAEIALNLPILKKFAARSH